MSDIINTVLSDTIGVGWRAVSGTVDPFTKQIAVDEATQAYIQAGMDPSVAPQQAEADITTALTGSSQGNSDPSNLLGGINDSLTRAGSLGETISKNILYIGLGIGVLFLVYIGFQNRSLLRG